MTIPTEEEVEAASKAYEGSTGRPIVRVSMRLALEAAQAVRVSADVERDVGELIKQLQFFDVPDCYGWEPAGFGTIKLEHVPKSVRILISQAADALLSLTGENARLREVIEDAIDTLEAMDLHTDNPLYVRLVASLSPTDGEKP